MTNPALPVWAERTFLVTGWSGFLGTWLVPRLCKEGARVVGFSRNESPTAAARLGPDLRDRFTVVQGSLADSKTLRDTIVGNGVDTIFHLAAQSKVGLALENPVETFETNIQGTWNLLEAVRTAARPVQVVVASSEAAFDNPVGARETETPAEALSPYAASKACAEFLAKCYNGSYGIMVTVARTSNLYGGGDLSYQRIIPGTIQSVIRGEAPVIRSSGLPKRDYLYVEDAVSGYICLARAMDRPEVCGETFSFTTGTAVSVLTVVETILRLMQRMDLKPTILRQETNEIPVRHTPSSRPRAEIGWCPDSSLVSGLEKTIAWYRSHAAEVCAEEQN